MCHDNYIKSFFKIENNEATSKPQVTSCTTELDLSEKLEVLTLNLMTFQPSLNH